MPPKILDKQHVFRRGDQGFAELISNLESHDIPYEVVVRTPTKPRSLSENSYYWGVIIQIISDETGHEPNEVHYFMRQMFLRIDDGLSKIPKTRSTTTLSTYEAETYYQKIRDWAWHELNIDIPKPNEPPLIDVMN